MADKTIEPTITYQTLTISSIQQEAPGVKVFTFHETLPYKAGQYLTLVHTGPLGEVRRSYSITSSPVLQEPLAIGVKRIENGFFSRQLIDHAKVGDTLLTTGAAGLFTLPENVSEYKQIFLLAAGSGITPIYSLLKTALHAHPELSVVLLYSNSTPERTMFLEPLQQLAVDFPDTFHLQLFFSNSPDLSSARLHKDMLIMQLHRLAKASYPQTLFYLCGPTNYMRITSFALRQQLVPAANIRKEIFNTDNTKPPKITPPDTGKHNVTLRIKGSTYKIESQYPLNILQSARKAGIAIPYSCETGKCGSCLARVNKGSVWMSYNEVLTDKDIQKGLTLTCVGYPVGGDVDLEIL